MSSIDTVRSFRMGGDSKAFKVMKLDYKSDKNATTKMSESSLEKFRVIQL